MIVRTKIEQYVIDRARELRYEHNMTQADLAFKLDLSTGFIGKVEAVNCDTKYNLNHINALARIFSKSPQYFLPANSLED